MRESTIVPTNLLDWPRVADRLPEEKLVLVAVWLGRGWMRSCGCGELPLRPFSASLGLSPEAALTGVRNLAAPNVGLLAIDESTMEVFVLDWFRFHRFRGVGIQIARRDIEKTISPSIKKLIIEKSKTCLPTATATATSAAEAADAVTCAAASKKSSGAGDSPARRRRKFHPTGIHMWTDEDFIDADAMVAEFGAEATARAVESLHAAGVKPLPSRVREELERLEALLPKSTVAPPSVPPLVIDPAAQAAGAAILEKIRKKQSINQGAAP